MHELGLAMEVAGIVQRRSQGRAVSRVVVEVGALAAVMPDALDFAWQMVRIEADLPDAELTIVPLLARGACASCKAEVETDQAWATCSCGSADVRWSSGDELRVAHLEVR